jgi:hypothetical protein
MIVLSSPTRSGEQRALGIDRNADECNRHRGHQLCHSDMVRTVVQVDRRRKLPRSFECVCVADAQYESEKCTGQYAVDWSMGKWTGEVLLMSKLSFEGRKNVGKLHTGKQR